MLASGFLSRDAYTAWKPQIQGSWNSTVGFWSFPAPYCWRTDAEAETAILWPPDANWLIWRLWCWQRLKAGEGEDDRGWDGWMASPTQWTWVWVSSGSWWWTGKPGVLWSTGSQRDTTEWLNWTELSCWRTELTEFLGWGSGMKSVVRFILLLWPGQTQCPPSSL